MEPCWHKFQTKKRILCKYAKSNLELALLGPNEVLETQAGAGKRSQDKPFRTGHDKSRHEKSGLWWIFDAQLALERSGETSQDWPRWA